MITLFIGQCKTPTADCRLQTADCGPGVKCRLRVKRRQCRKKNKKVGQKMRGKNSVNRKKNKNVGQKMRGKNSVNNSHDGVVSCYELIVTILTM